MAWPREYGAACLFFAALGLALYARHARWVTSEAYSSPSIVLISGHGANRYVLDDFREAYYWLRHNTAPDAKIMSWCARCRAGCIVVLVFVLCACICACG
jgi:hypothetical protein